MIITVQKHVSEVAEHEYARQRRLDNAAKNCCINGAHHGPPIARSSRCAWCTEVHRRGVAAVVADPLWNDRRPPGYKPPRGGRGRFATPASADVAPDFMASTEATS